MPGMFTPAAPIDLEERQRHELEKLVWAGTMVPVYYDNLFDRFFIGQTVWNLPERPKFAKP